MADENLKNCIENMIGDQFLSATLSNPRAIHVNANNGDAKNVNANSGDANSVISNSADANSLDVADAKALVAEKLAGVSKIKLRPVQVKGERLFQFESFKNNQAFHENMDGESAKEALLSYMEVFKQLEAETTRERLHVLISKKGKATVKTTKQMKVKTPVESGHNRQKKYILKEGTPVPFLVDLSVMTADGKIRQPMFDKFKQINRFLEFIEDILPKLPKDREITILDFGCGKSYLTFAMYYYLHDLQKYDIRVIGLDLKTEVIKNCNALAEKYGYSKLKFLEGNIADYTGVDEVDMVVTLHACDTATDFALEKAVGWNAKVILSVPCCQHEINKKWKKDGKPEAKEALSPMMDYGLLRERMAALYTDGLRAKYLESVGYDVQVLEFIDMEHTPKNILLRGVKMVDTKHSKEKQERAKDILAQSKAFFDVESCMLAGRD